MLLQRVERYLLIIMHVTNFIWFYLTNHGVHKLVLINSILSLPFYSLEMDCRFILVYKGRKAKRMFLNSVYKNQNHQACNWNMLKWIEMVILWRFASCHDIDVGLNQMQYDIVILQNNLKKYIYIIFLTSWN